MFESNALPPESSGPPSDHGFAERVMTRINHARRDMQLRARSTPASRRPRRTADLDTRALRRVFRDLGDSYRSYRLRTGSPVIPEVREAALRFRRELDLTSLLSVAGSLDRIDRDLVG
jgi:hypothetical protein